MNTFEDRINNYKRLQDDMLNTFIDKDSDYGDSFGKTFEKYGIVSALIRMSAKMNRLDNLASNSNQMKVDESIEDTLLDLANYAMLTYLQIHKPDEKSAPWVVSEEDKKLKSVAESLNKVQAKGADEDTPGWPASAPEAFPDLDTISDQLKETKAKGLNKDTEYRAPLDSDEFNRRSVEINKPGTMFMYPGSDRQFGLEETEDFKKYMSTKISLEDLVNNLYSKIVVE